MNVIKIFLLTDVTRREIPEPELHPVRTEQLDVQGGCHQAGERRKVQVCYHHLQAGFYYRYQ